MKFQKKFKTVFLISIGLLITFVFLPSFWIKSKTDQAAAKLNIKNLEAKLEQREVEFIPTRLDFIENNMPFPLFVIFGVIRGEKHSLSLLQSDAEKINFQINVPIKINVFYSAKNPKSLFLRHPKETINIVTSMKYYHYLFLYLQFMKSFVF
jgi:hypothetical protein